MRNYFHNDCTVQTLFNSNLSAFLRSITALLAMGALVSGCSGPTQSPDGVSTNGVYGGASNNDTVLEQDGRMALSDADSLSLMAQIKPLLSEARNSLYGYEATRSLTTEIGARPAGTDAEARARDWAVGLFQDIGLENIRIEPFTIEGWSRGVERASIITPYPQDMVITALGGSVATPSQGIIAPVVHFDSFTALQEAPEGGLEGKIVFISDKMEKAPDGAGYGPANRKRRSGASEAGKRGALAVIIRSVGTSSHRFAHTGQMRYEDGIVPIPIGALSAPDADQLVRVLGSGQDVQMSLTLTPRFTGPELSGNVIGEIIGTDTPEEIVLIAAHLDSWDLGTGAIDDGAGIGIIAGAAKAIVQSGMKPRRTIRIVAFGAEEVGLLGAHAYVKLHADTLVDHVLATESDFGAGKPYEVHQSVKSGQDVIASMAEIMELPFNPKAETNGGPDIGPLHDKGVPAMRFQQDGIDYFDLHHTPDDTFDKIEPEDMAKNVAAFTVMAWIAANTDTNFR